MKRREITVRVTLSLAPGVTVTQAKQELRTRCNSLCGYGGPRRVGAGWLTIEEADVQISKIERV